jgi:predicted HicB family RNase H-like nuclease
VAKVSSAVVEMPNDKKDGKSWLQVQIDDELKTLLRVEAARHNVSMASIVEELIAKNLTDRANSKGAKTK